jgi:hypothetical protein
MAGMRKVDDAKVPEQVYQVLSLDARTGEVKDTREVRTFASIQVFATNDAHVIVSGKSVLRLTADLKDDGSFDGRVQNISPDVKTYRIDARLPARPDAQ